MAQAYTTADLGYPRTPTSGHLRVTFPSGEVWRVPLQVVADDRDRNYADEKEDTVGFVRAGQLSRYTLEEWAINNMNWSDLAPYAVQVKPPPPADPHEQWLAAEREAVNV